MANEMRIGFIDHYDSFSLNVVDWLRRADEQVVVEQIYYDDYQKMRSLCDSPIPFVISPGPKSPKEVPSTLEVVKSLWGKVPMLGVCLGHQILAWSQNARIVRSKNPMHGERKGIRILQSEGIFAGMEGEIQQAVYHSLVVDPASLDPASAKVLAICEDGEVQALEFLSAAPTMGIQFHPESFLSVPVGGLIARNWIRVLELRGHPTVPKF